MVKPMATTAAVTFTPDVDLAQKLSGVLPLGPNQTRVTCPRCGSPYLATFASGAPRGLGAADGTFTCTAGDCGYSGPPVRS